VLRETSRGCFRKYVGDTGIVFHCCLRGLGCAEKLGSPWTSRQGTGHYTVRSPHRATGGGREIECELQRKGASRGLPGFSPALARVSCDEWYAPVKFCELRIRPLLLRQSPGARCRNISLNTKQNNNFSHYETIDGSLLFLQLTFALRLIRARKCPGAYHPGTTTRCENPGPKKPGVLVTASGFRRPMVRRRCQTAHPSAGQH